MRSSPRGVGGDSLFTPRNEGDNEGGNEGGNAEAGSETTSVTGSTFTGASGASAGTGGPNTRGGGRGRGRSRRARYATSCCRQLCVLSGRTCRLTCVDPSQMVTGMLGYLFTVGINGIAFYGRGDERSQYSAQDIQVREVVLCTV